MSETIQTAIKGAETFFGTLSYTPAQQVQSKSILTTLISSESFASQIKTDIGSITAGNPLDPTHIPAIIHLILTSWQYFTKLPSVNIKMMAPEIVEGVIYGVLYFVLLEINIPSVDILILLKMFPSIWNLIEYELPKIEAKCLSFC